MSIMVRYNIPQTHEGEILERRRMQKKKKKSWHDHHHVLCGAVWQRPLRQAALAVVSYCNNEEDTSSSDAGYQKAAVVTAVNDRLNLPAMALVAVHIKEPANDSPKPLRISASNV